MRTFDTGDVILDRYEITGVLGEGGMGRVLAALDRQGDIRVALKFLRSNLLDDPQHVSRFREEARTAFRMTSSHVVRVSALEEVDGVPFIVMGYLSGHDLARVLLKRGPLPVAEAVDLLLGAAEAIAEAHALGIVHRDLKPSNLFLSDVHGKTTLIVLDFGIAKTIDTDRPSAGRVPVFGSPGYMSPEQYAGVDSVDARADVWSLGVVLYEMLTAVRPFPGDTVENARDGILRGNFARVSDYRGDVPPALDAMLAELLVVDRAKRIASVEAFATRLAPFGTEEARASCAYIQGVAAAARAAAARRTGVRRRPRVAGAVAEERSSADTPKTARCIAFGIAAGAILWAGIRAQRTVNDPALACMHGDGAACDRLARYFDHAEGGTRHIPYAIKFYARACRLQVASACVSFGTLTMNDGVEFMSKKVATELFGDACLLGSALGCLRVSDAYLEGRGVDNDVEMAAIVAALACASGSIVGCLRSAAVEKTGDRVAPDVPTSLFQLAGCLRGDWTACDEWTMKSSNQGEWSSLRSEDIQLGATFEALDAAITAEEDARLNALSDEKLRELLPPVVSDIAKNISD